LLFTCQLKLTSDTPAESAHTVCNRHTAVLYIGRHSGYRHSVAQSTYATYAGLQLVHTTLWQSDDESDDAEVELQSWAAHIELIIPFTASANKLRDADKKNWKQDLLQ